MSNLYTSNILMQNISRRHLTELSTEHTLYNHTYYRVWKQIHRVCEYTVEKGLLQRYGPTANDVVRDLKSSPNRKILNMHKCMRMFLDSKTLLTNKEYNQGANEIWNKHSVSETMYICAKWPESIACDYNLNVKSDKENDVDIETLTHICRKQGQKHNTSYTNESFVLNIEAHDLVMNTEKIASRAANIKKKVHTYMQKGSVIDIVYRQCDTICYQYTTGYSRSHTILVHKFIQIYNTVLALSVKKLKTELENIGVSVSVRVFQNADKQFIFTCNSKKFIRDSGVFNNVVARVVQQIGHQLIE